MSDTCSKDSIGFEFDVVVTKDVCYGIGGVHFGDNGVSGRTREMLVDVYAPAAIEVDDKLPALLLAFGGAFHRGSKDDDTFEDGDWHNTPIAEYCREYASRGFVCFSVDYRLTGEEPDPEPERWLTHPETISRSRMDHVRGLLGLPPATSHMLADGMEAAINDVASAFRYIVTNASEYNVDVSRTAIGGFSAGGTCALYSVFACGVPAAAVVAISGRMEAADIQHYITGSRSTPVLQIVGEHDLEYVRKLSHEQASHCSRVSIPHSLVEVPGAGHFYSRHAKTIRNDGRASTVDRSIVDFLETFLTT